MPNNSFRKVKVDKRSGFDKSFRNTLTGKTGTLIPILVDELIPDTKVNLKLNLAASLPPLVSDTYMNVRLRVEAFAVPHRLCQANFEDFYCDYPVEVFDQFDDAGVNTTGDMKGCMPLIRVNDAFRAIPTGSSNNGTLMDYLGIPTFDTWFDYDVPVAPFVAYHLIWQEWFRNPRVQRAAFVRPMPPGARGEVVNTYVGDTFDEVNELGIVFACSLPYCNFYFGQHDGGSQPVLRGSNQFSSLDTAAPYWLSDSDTFITDLRQRNFGLDFFTAAMVEPQQGPSAKVEIVAGGQGQADSFTIASLRAQNSIQQFRERNNLTSPRYQQQIYARYGVAPSDGVIQRPVLIGAGTYDVYTHGVTATSFDDASLSGANPFSGVLGQRAGNAFASGSDFIISGFHAKEPMYLFVLASLVPEVSYSQNFNPIFLRYKGLGSITDMANGILQNVGPQPIFKGMLGMAASDVEFNEVFAYTDRYSDWMFKNNEVHGEFKEYQGGTLKSFVLQRTFTDLPEFGSEFLEIPTDYLDGVLMFNSDGIKLSYWLDVACEYKVSMPLQEYAIPSLQDPGYEHGRTITLRKNGQLL